MTQANIEADTISYSTVVKTCAGARDVDRAEHWLSEIMQADGEADTISYSTADKACSEARDVARAEHRLSEMMQAGRKGTLSGTVMLTLTFPSCRSVSRA